MSTTSIAAVQPRPSTTVRSTEARQAADRRRRTLEGVGFVAVWVTLGYLLPITDEGYLLLGIPLTVIFQTRVRRRPLRELWTDHTPMFTLDRAGRALATVLIIAPAAYGIRTVAADGDWVEAAWCLAAMGGALAAAFAIRAGSPTTLLRSAVLPTLVGSAGMIAVLGAVHIVDGNPTLSVPAALAAVAKYTAIYFPATFALEEVAFRGALDAHVHHDGDSHPWRSAIVVSALWGLWHLPVATGLPLPVLLVTLPAAHIVLGVPLSFAWRRTHNLTGPALAHATIDAVRNALLGL